MVSTRLAGSRHHKFCPKAPGHSNNEVNCIFKSFLHMFASIFICTGPTNLLIIRFSVNWLTVLMHTDFKEVSHTSSKAAVRNKFFPHY